MANCLTNVWAFRIICLVELERNALFSPHPIQPEPQTSNFSNLAHVQTQIDHLSRLILRSVDYFFGDNMKLFGPASILFPLSVAHQRLKVTRATCDGEIEFIKANGKGCNQEARAV